MLTRHASRIAHHARSALTRLAVLSLAIPTAFAAFVAVPSLDSPVTDLTNTLTHSQIQSLDESLRAFEQRKGSQVAVLIVPTTGDEALEQYSLRVVEKWKIGRKNVNDGVLFLIAKDDRAMRIEVGYGLEGALPDVAAKRIIRDVVTPRFQQGEFYLGIVAGTDRIMSAVSGEPLPEPTFTERARRPNSGIGSMFPILIGIAVVVGRVVRATLGRFLGSLITGGAIGLILWVVMGVLIVAIIGAVLAFFISLMAGGGGGWSSGRRGWGSRSYGGFGGSSGGSWGGGRSSGLGSGWGGGGGSFGGGGASGRW